MIEPVGGSIYDRWKVWDRFRPQFLEALERCHGTHTEDDVLVRIAAKQYQIWDGTTCATVTFPVEHPQFRALNVFLAAGDVTVMVEVMDEAEKWATKNGFKRMMCGGRRGWGRAFEGAESMGELFYKDL